MLEQDAHFATPAESPVVDIKDQDDLVILSSALNGKADLFVAGDKELLDLGKVKGLHIVSPRAFWEKLKAEPAEST